MKLFSTLLKKFLKTVFKIVLNFYKTFSKLFLNFFSFVWLSPCFVISLLLLLWTICTAAPIAPRHAASRHADRHARCAALRIVCIGYRNTPLLPPTAKARTLCVYIVKPIGLKYLCTHVYGGTFTSGCRWSWNCTYSSGVKYNNYACDQGSLGWLWITADLSLLFSLFG